MQVSFGSTYAIKYDYTLYKYYGFASKNPGVIKFVEHLNKQRKSRSDITAVNPEKKTYYYKTKDDNDVYFEAFADKSNIKVKKVSDKELEGATITSVGKCNNEINRVSRQIGLYKQL